MNTWSKLASFVVMIVVGLSQTGCETKAQTGALVGGAGGAGVGAAAGSFSGNAGKGALIGGAIGAIGGYIVGNEMDKKDAREDRYERSTRAGREERYADAPPAKSAGRVTKVEVIDWTKDGVKDEIIIDRIDQSGTTFRLTAADENELRDAGVSEDVVRAMKNAR
jgi:uncharacterized protein YcfJ